jgi:hypothetical protein
MKQILIFIFLVHNVFGFSQVLETKNWCLSICNIVGDEKENTELIFLQTKNDSIKNSMNSNEIVRFPLRVVIIQNDSLKIGIDEIKVRTAINNLNYSFSDVGIVFYIHKINVILSPLHLEELSQNRYSLYNTFSDIYDLEDMISIYIFEHERPFCEISPTTLSCSRVGGFSYVLSDRTSNIVMSKFDLDDQKIFAHEVGHFFGLYHTFEKDQYGEDDFDDLHCNTKGDRMCDTPPDPGGVFDIYVNYSTCEMNEHMDSGGHLYKPMINNFMSYYKPCYMKTYAFSLEQKIFLRLSSRSDLRKKYSR